MGRAHSPIKGGLPLPLGEDFSSAFVPQVIYAFHSDP
jgi:hypothetical protein